MVFFLVGCFALSTFFEQEKVDIQEIRETRGMFISYIELSNYLKGKDRKEGEKSIKNMVSNVYDLGLIYKIQQAENGDLNIEMTLTAPGCPVAGILPQQVADAAAGVKGVGKVEVKVVWEPAWTMDRLSEEAKAMLELF